jgi:dihydroorotase
MNFDLLLKGGHLIDPKNNLDALKDLAIANGKVAAVDDDIPAGQAQKVLDVSGLYITPGLVDIHTHMYATPGWRNAWAGDNSILPDGFSFRSGVTTMVDTGSAGWRTFPDFRDRVLDRFQTRMYAFVNIAGLGMISSPWNRMWRTWMLSGRLR